MSNLADLEKKINSELVTKIKFSEIFSVYLFPDLREPYSLIFFSPFTIVYGD